MSTFYEIRYQLLEMARNMLMDEYYSKREKLVSQWERDYAANSTNSKYPDLPEFPNDAKIIEVAAKLDGFVVSGDMK